MKTLKPIAFFLCLVTTALVVTAADNDKAAPRFSTESVGVRVRTTETDGVHTEHVIIAGTSASASTTAATFSQGSKSVVAAGTPERLVASTTLVESVEIHARKNTTTANTGAIYLGFSATPGSNYRVLLAGESFSISAPAGKKIDLYLIYVDAATSADAVTYSAVN